VNGSFDAKHRGYFASERFAQNDLYGGSYNFTDLQSHRYEYTKNDPVNFRDPSGLGIMAIYIASDIASDPNIMDIAITATEVRELGNALAHKFIGNPRRFPKAQSAWLRRFDSEAGMALEECAFGGAVTSNTGQVSTNP